VIFTNGGLLAPPLTGLKHLRSQGPQRSGRGSAGSLSALTQSMMTMRSAAPGEDRCVGDLVRAQLVAGVIVRTEATTAPHRAGTETVVTSLTDRGAGRCDDYRRRRRPRQGTADPLWWLIG